MSKRKFAVGDRVTICRKVARNPWVYEMNHTVGMSGIIIKKGGGFFDIQLDGGKVWWYPKSAVKREVKA